VEISNTEPGGLKMSLIFWNVTNAAALEIIFQLYRQTTAHTSLCGGKYTCGVLLKSIPNLNGGSDLLTDICKINSELLL
jgi:hypothetical protein